jgi:hypothetical protein
VLDRKSNFVVFRRRKGGRCGLPAPISSPDLIARKMQLRPADSGHFNLPVPAPTPRQPSACVRCGAAFTCGEVAGTANCWCADLPRLRRIDAALPACLCPACLQAALKEQDNAELSHPPSR